MKNINQKVRGKPGRVREIAVLAGVTVFALGVAFAPDIKNSIEFRQAYSQALEQYKYPRKEGFVSKEERKELFDNIFYKKGIIFNWEGLKYPAKYSNGKEVPIYELTKIIRNYIEHPFPLGE